MKTNKKKNEIAFLTKEADKLSDSNKKKVTTKNLEFVNLN